jgi:hypothetical protein
MTTETRAEFARRMGWHRSSVTRAVEDGRVVLLNERVDVEASLAKIAALASPSAHHRAHAQQLEEARETKQAPVDVPEAVKDSVELLNLRLKRAEADKREHEAESARMDREERAGNLIKREDVEFALDDFGATLRSLMENFADRLAPVVHPLQSMEETHAALAEAANDVLQMMHDQMQQQAQERRAA